MHPCDLAGGLSDLEMTRLLYCAGAATGALSRRGLHTIKLAYDHMLAGWPAELTVSAFNRVC